jgi:tetratricopeptide (TPR) repeat protein
VRYLRLAVWPSPQVFDYGVFLARSAMEIVPQAALLVALLAATMLALRRAPPLGFIGLFFFVVLAPTSTVVPVETQTGNEHRIYLALAALIAGVVLAGHRWVLPRLRLAPTLALVCAVAGALALATRDRNRDYASAVTLWRDTADKWPRNARAHSNLAHALIEAGRPREALAATNRALALWPRKFEALANRGLVHRTLGRLDEAVADYTAAIAVRPDAADAYYARGNAHAAAGRHQKAIEDFTAALERLPDYADARYNRANAYLRLRRLDEAIADYTRVLALRPQDMAARGNRAVAYYSAGDRARARADVQAIVAAGHQPPAQLVAALDNN